MYWISERDEQKNPQISEAVNGGMFGFFVWKMATLNYLCICFYSYSIINYSTNLCGTKRSVLLLKGEISGDQKWSLLEYTPLKKERSDSGKPSHRSFDMKLLSYLYVCMLFFLCWNLQPLKKKTLLIKTNKKVIEIKWQHILNALGKRLP